MPVTQPLLDAWRRVPSLAVDAGLAAVIALVTFVTIGVEDAREPSDLSPAGAAAVAVQCLALVWRRSHPLHTAAVCAVAASAYGMAEQPDPPVPFATMLALYSVAAYCRRPVAIAWGLFAAAALAVGMSVTRDADAADVAINYFTGVTAWVVGDTTRTQRERSAWLEARRADATRQAAADERVRIARDLHDIVAHHVSVIAVQAEAAQEVLAARPDRAEKAMADVADTARTALGELRRLLGVLRSAGGLAPQADLSSVGELVESARRAGLDVTFRAPGDDHPVDGLVGVTAYRIVQEALTNVMRHAAARRADVEVAIEGDDVVVTVTDDGRAGRPGGGAGRAAGSPARTPGEGTGHGLTGMRERVAILGGTLETGPRPGGGFAVRARLPRS